MHRRPRSRLRMAALSLLIIVVVACLGFATTLVLPQGPDTAESVTVTISESSPDDMVRVLEDAGVLRYPTAFRVLLGAWGRKVRFGQYTVTPHLSVWSLAKILTTTDPVVERTIRIIEGWDLRDLARYLEAEGISSPDAFFQITGSPAVDYRFASAETIRPTDLTSEFEFLKEKPDTVSLEGYLFPDTYRVFDDAEPGDVIRKMLQNTQQKLSAELLAEVQRSGRSFHQIITMASIIEAEIAEQEDRMVASGLLWKRRDRGMLLQVDASVNYITGKHDPRVARQDSTVDSSFNTYRYPGLPPGPIGNPGMDAILAALRPKESPYWFFLTSKDGKTIFSRTFEEHTQNVRKYLR